MAVVATLIAGCKKDDDKKTTDVIPGPTTQVPVAQENTGLTQKFSGTKCPPCGSWGWTMADELITYGNGKALFMGTFSQNFVAEGFITTVASDMDTKWGAGGKGYPVFSVNGVLKADRNSGVNTTSEKAMCNSAMDAHKAAPVVANTGVEMTITGTTLKIKASTKFFKDATGDYNVAFYVVEDNAMWKQSGHPQGASPIAHHHVLRGAVNGTWGETHFTGTEAAGSFKDINYEMQLNSTWVASNLDVYAVIWKKNGSSYEFVNASSAK